MKGEGGGALGILTCFSAREAGRLEAGLTGGELLLFVVGSEALIGDLIAVALSQIPDWLESRWSGSRG